MLPSGVLIRDLHSQPLHGMPIDAFDLRQYPDLTSSFQLAGAHRADSERHILPLCNTFPVKRGFSQVFILLFVQGSCSLRPNSSQILRSLPTFGSHAAACSLPGSLRFVVLEKMNRTE